MSAGPPYVGVIGAGEASEDELATAEEVGRLLAEAGAVVVCGGLGGVMEAAARGCARAGGTTVGILPGNDRSSGSPDLTVTISTGIGEARNAIITRTVDAVIAVGGGSGTLSEIGLALRMGKPVIGLSTWTFAKDAPDDDPVIRARSALEAVKVAVREAQRAGGGRAPEWPSRGP